MSDFQTRVVATSAKGVWCPVNDEVIFFHLPSKYLQQRQYPCALGDLVTVDLTQSCITGLLGRPNQLTRKRREKATQTVASHISKAIICVSFVKKKLPLLLIDRMVTGVMQQKVPCELWVTKRDTWKSAEESLFETISEYYTQELSLQVRGVSGLKPDSIHSIFECWKCDPKLPVVVFLGPSGVGKSTLISALIGNAIEVNSVNPKTGKGRHTTSQPQLYPYNDYLLGDCPGIKTWFPEPDDLFNCFPDLVSRSPECDLDRCDHTPNFSRCPISMYWTNHSENDLASSRYKSYVDILTNPF